MNEKIEYSFITHRSLYLVIEARGTLPKHRRFSVSVSCIVDESSMDIAHTEVVAAVKEGGDRIVKWNEKSALYVASLLATSPL